MPDNDGPSTAELFSWLDDAEPPKRHVPYVRRESEAEKVYRQHMANIRRQKETGQLSSHAALAE